MVDVISRAVMASSSVKPLWPPIKRYITTLFDEPRPPSLDPIITLISPHCYLRNKDAVTRWAEAALAVQHTEEVGWSVVDVLLQIACDDSLRPHIPFRLWAWVKNQRSLPPDCLGRYRGSYSEVVQFVRGLGDVEILTSYLLLVWSEWDWPSGVDEMEISIRAGFGGVGMRRHREVLVERLDHVLGQLDRGLGHLRQHKPWFNETDVRWVKQDYGRLKRVLLEVGRGGVDIPTCASPRFIRSDKILIPMTRTYRISLNTHSYSALPPPRSKIRNGRHHFSDAHLVVPHVSFPVVPIFHRCSSYVIISCGVKLQG